MGPHLEHARHYLDQAWLQNPYPGMPPPPPVYPGFPPCLDPYFGAPLPPTPPWHEPPRREPQAKAPPPQLYSVPWDAPPRDDRWETHKPYRQDGSLSSASTDASGPFSQSEPKPPPAPMAAPPAPSGEGATRKMFSIKPAAPAATAEPEGAKGQLLNLIYDLMTQKGYTSTKGHLVMDVYIEIWKEVVGQAATEGTGRTAIQRFAQFLSSAPDLFEVFDLNIVPMKVSAVEEAKYWYRREKMVRLKPRD